MFSTTSPVVSGAGRGDVSIQPAYFTSSLFVNPLREDIADLVQEFDAQLKLHPEAQPFAVFKSLWVELGWSWLHLKILEPRAREMFLDVVLRLFLEQTRSSEPVINRAVGVMSAYTFFATQPSTSVPTIHSTKHIPIAIDRYEELMRFPLELEHDMSFLKPTVTYILRWMVQQAVFTIIPASHLHSENPRSLPREMINPEINAAVSDGDSIPDGSRKKTGRPSKAEKQQRAKAALGQLDKWLEKSSYPDGDDFEDPTSSTRVLSQYNEAENDERTTHILLSQRPLLSLETYRRQKEEMLGLVPESNAEDDPIERASCRVLTRLKEIDAVAAERGLEIGTEGGEKSGLGRVEKAMGERGGFRGLLGLVDGAGLDNK